MDSLKLKSRVWVEYEARKDGAADHRARLIGGTVRVKETEQAKKRIQVTFEEWKECNFTYRALWSIESGLTLRGPESRGLQGYS